MQTYNYSPWTTYAKQTCLFYLTSSRMAIACIALLVISGTTAVVASGSAPLLVAWPNKTVSWWVNVDSNWPHAIAQITPYVGNATSRSIITSIQSSCGYTVSAAGAIAGSLSNDCANFFRATSALGVRNEIWLDAGNCDIVAYRALWADTTNSPRVLLSAALAANVSGWNIDLEPQADNCAGVATGTAADAVPFAAWLTAVRAVLAPHNIRLTVDVCSWSPVLSQFAVLAPAVDRLLNMETYNGDSASQWSSYYSEFVKAIPRASAGVGLGAWSDGKSAWWETPAGASFKVNRSVVDGILELAVFRIAPSVEQNPPWPLEWWWAALEQFVAS